MGMWKKYHKQPAPSLWDHLLLQIESIHSQSHLLKAMSMTSNISSSYSSPSVFSPIPPLKFQSLLPTFSPLVSSSSKSVATNFLSDEALTIAAAKEAVSLASIAVKAAKEAVVLASRSEESWNGDLIARRKKRSKRRKGFDYLEMEEEKETLCEGALPEPVNCGYLSSIEEAELCLSLKDEARLEVARRRIAEIQEHEPTMKQLADAMRMGKRSIDKITCKGRASRERISHNYRRLVISIARSYRGKGVSLQDLIQEGSIGLLRGAERFDPRRGSKLSTYAYWWIKEAIITSISKKSRLVRLPGSMQDKITKIAEAKIYLRKRLGRLPSYDEIAEVLNIKVSTVRLGIQMSRSPLSLDQAVSDQGGMTIKEIIPGPDEMLPEKMLQKELMKQEMEKLMETLSEREACILRLSFGLNGQTPRSHEEIGRLMKLSRERIRQISKIALSKLRYRSIMDDFKVYIV